MSNLKINNLNPEKTRERDACARGRGSLADLVAAVEKMAESKASARQIAAAVRAFAERDASLAAPAPGRATVWIPVGSPEWTAWAAHWRATRGKNPPVDKHSG